MFVVNLIIFLNVLLVLLLLLLFVFIIIIIIIILFNLLTSKFCREVHQWKDWREQQLRHHRRILEKVFIIMIVGGKYACDGCINGLC